MAERRSRTAKKKTKKKAPRKSESPEIVILNESEDIPVLYVNNAQAIGSIMEIRLDLGQIEDRDIESNKLFVRERIRLYMSWPFTERLVKLLQGQMRQMTDIFEAAAVEQDKEKKS